VPYFFASAICFGENKTFIKQKGSTLCTFSLGGNKKILLPSLLHWQKAGEVLKLLRQWAKISLKVELQYFLKQKGKIRNMEPIL